MGSWRTWIPWALATLGVASSAYLWRSLEAERAMRNAPESSVPAVSPLGGAPDASSADTGPAPAPAQVPVPQAVAAPTTAVAATSSGPRDQAVRPDASRRDLWADPRYLADMRTRMRTAQYQAFAGLVSEAGVTRAELDALVELLVSQQEHDGAEFRAEEARLRKNRQRMSEQEWRNLESERRRRSEERLARNDVELRAHLGDARFDQFHAYRDSIGARQALQPMLRQLQDSGQPLNDSQWRALVAAVSANKLDDPWTNFAGNLATLTPRMQALPAQHAAATERLRPLAASILSADQYRAFMTLRERELASLRTQAMQHERDYGTSGVQR